MIVRTTAEITGTDRDVADANWRSKRIILAGDGVGFSFHETTINASSVSEFHYQHHVEAVGPVVDDRARPQAETEGGPVETGTLVSGTGEDADGEDRNGKNGNVQEVESSWTR